MAKGAIAKSKVAEKIKEAFGDAYLGEMGGKLFIEMDDGGETVQVAINMTCPKILFEKGGPAAAAPAAPVTSAFGVGSAEYNAATTPAPAITEDEKENIQALMARLGL